MFGPPSSLCRLITQFMLPTGTEKLATISKVGTLDCWMKLKLPITQSTHLFQERSERRPFNTSPQSTDTINNNELIINIIRCTDLPMSTQGMYTDKLEYYIHI